MSKEYKEVEYLKREYVENGRSTTEIAKDFDVTHGTISHHLHKNDIETGERGRIKSICPDCNIPYRSIGQHLEKSDCERPEIGYVEEEMLKGLVMGDGSVTRNQKNWMVLSTMTNERFLNWFDWRIGDLGVSVVLGKTGEESEIEARERGFEPVNGYRDIFYWRSIPHPTIKQIFGGWFLKEKKKEISQGLRTFSHFLKYVVLW